MAREFAQVKVSIWQDDDFQMLPPHAQLLYFQLMTSPTLSHCGVADWRPNRIAAKSEGWTTEQVVAAGQVLVDRLYVVINESTEEVLLRSFIRNDGLMKQPRMAVSMAIAFAGTASRTLRGVLVHELNRLYTDEPDLVGWAKPQALQLLSMSGIDPASVRAKLGVNEPPSQAQTVRSLGVDLGVRKGSPTPTPAPAPTDSRLHPAPRNFETFWDHYPKRVGKDAAKRAFEKAIRRADVMRILDGVRRMAADPNLPEKQFIPDPASWLNSGRWDDEPYPPRADRAARGSTSNARVSDALAAGARLMQAQPRELGAS